MLNYQTAEEWITPLFFHSSPPGRKYFCCGPTVHPVQGSKALTFLLVPGSNPVKDWGQTNSQWFATMWSNLLTVLPRITVLGDQADVDTSVLFVTAFDTVLHNVLVWKARHFMSGLPLIATENSMNFGAQSSQEKKKKIIFLSFAA